MKKSVISLLLTVLMVFGMFPFGAFAAETDAAYTADEDATVQEAETGEDAEPPQGEAEEPADAELADTGADDDLADTGAITVTGPVGVTGVTEPKNGYYPSYTGASVLNSSEYKINSTYSYGSYKNGIMWKDENGDYINPSSAPAFQTGKKYTVVVFLVPASSSYVFDENAIKAKTNTVNGNAATKVGFWNNKEMYIEYTFTAYRRLTYVSANISVPVPGNSPSYSCTVGDSSAYYATGSDTYYKNGIKWVEDGVDMTVTSGKKFVAGKKYTVYIALKPQTNHKFAPKASLSGEINGNSATVGEWTEGSYIYLSKEYTCTTQKISSVTITGVTAPVIGATPTYAATASGTGYKKEDLNNSSGWTSGVCWKDSSGNTLSSSSKFEAGKSYMVRVSVIRTSDAYEFSSSVNVKINGNTAVTSAWGGISKTENFIAEYTFPALTTTKVSSVYAYGVTEPKPGNSPVFSATVSAIDAKMDTYSSSANGWSNGVRWEDESGNALTTSSKFVAGKKYTVKVSVLRMSEAYEFTSSTTGKINGNTATVAPWSSNWSINIVLSRTFTCSGTLVSTVSASVTAPVIGAKPDTSGSTGNTSYYISSVKWLDADNSYATVTSTDTFKAGHRYQACVFARANSGYYFKTSGSDPGVSGFVNGYSATAVTMISGTDPDQGVCVKYTFPALKATVIGAASVNVTAPVIGAKVSKTATVSSGYTGYTVANMYWYNLTDGNYPSESDKFLENKEYRCFVDITANTGYEFKNSSGSPTVTGYVNGKSATVTKAGTTYSAAERVTLIYTYPKMTKTAVSTVATTVTGPAYGKAPSYVASATSSPYYEIYKMNYQNFKDGVCWIDDTANKTISPSDTSYRFIAGHRYTAQVMIKIKDSNVNNYKFADSVSGTMNGASAVVSGYGTLDKDVYRIMANSFLCSGGTEISSISSSITAPIIGKTPDFKASVSTKGVAIHFVTWYDNTAGKYIHETDAFLEGHQYSASVFYKTTDGYYFKNDGAKPDVTVGLNNKTAKANVAGDLSVVDYCSMNYSSSALSYTMVSSIALTNVKAPTGGAAPSYATPISGNNKQYAVYLNLSDSVKYKYGVCWYDKTAGEAVNPTDSSYRFIVGHVYQYQVLVYAVDGCKFSSPTATVNGKTASVVTLSGYPGDFYKLIYINFTCEPGIIDAVSATVTPPYAGAAIDKTGTPGDSSYTVDNVGWWDKGNGKWMKVSDTFVEGKQYTCNVYLSAAEGYNFKNDGSKPTLTGKINGNTAQILGVSGEDYKTYICASYTFTCTKATGFKVSGSMTSYLSDSDKITIALYKSGSEIPAYSKIVNGNANSYSVDNVAPGSYTMKVSKKNHVDREYAVTVNGANVTQDVKICPIGDANNDGKVNAKDSNAIMRHISKASILTDYNLLCANANGDTKVNAKDVNRILRHISKAEPLF